MEILVAEDEIISQKALRNTIEFSGEVVLMAENGLKAWEKFCETPIRMVITDWMMPEMDGIELCRKIRRADLDDYVYIILLTAKDRAEDAVAGLEAGADDYIIKPFDPNELRARIRAGQRIIELEDSKKKASRRLLQSEKMASIGQLAAGIAHEINNPIGFINSNIHTLTEYEMDSKELIAQYRSFAAEIKTEMTTQEGRDTIVKKLNGIFAFEEKIDINFMTDDISSLLKECREGIKHIKNIVKDLKSCAYNNEPVFEYHDINNIMSSALNVVWNELKYSIVVTREYGDLPLVGCYSQLLSQVFINLLVNAGQAIEEKGEIQISTKAADKYIEISIRDTGEGIPAKDLSKIFDPFFTTKKVGAGTGLGLNVAYNIIKNHGGEINVESTIGIGTTFLIKLPCQHDDIEQISHGQ